MLDVIVMTYYMTGDSNSVASALRLQPKVRVVILGLNTDGRTLSLANFFAAKLGEQRVRVIPFASDGEARAAMATVKRKESNPEAHAKLVKEIAFQFGEKAANLHVPGLATTLIADAFGKKPLDARQILRDFWTAEGLPFKHFLFEHVGLHPDRKYVFLWCKKGKLDAEKAHHFTDRASWQELITALEGGEWTPVLVGDDIGLTTKPSMTEFWNEWTRVYGQPLPRDQQLSLWTF
ncbi:MAG TPA: hypothetical protein VF625_17095, partial [Longimicrobium sp.]